VLVACWSVKGDSGSTVVAAALAVLAARAGPGEVLLVDLAGDAPAALGVSEPSGPGLGDWLAAQDDVGPDALARLEIAIAPALTVLPWGSDAGLRPGRAEALVSALGRDDRTVVVDAGMARVSPGLDLASGATESLLVLRPCYLALRRAVAAPVRPSAVVLVREAGRALTRRDVEEVLGVPVRAEVDVDPAVARAVDAGLLAGRLPRSLAHSLRGLVCVDA
jgi:hypothetical protein